MITRLNEIIDNVNSKYFDVNNKTIIKLNHIYISDENICVRIYINDEYEDYYLHNIRLNLDNLEDKICELIDCLITFDNYTSPYHFQNLKCKEGE